jgi:hypothetical protein
MKFVINQIIQVKNCFFSFFFLDKKESKSQGAVKID